MKTFTRIAAVLALGLSLGACESREGPVERRAEKAGREADQVRPGTQNADEAGEKAKDRLNEAGEDVKRETNEATK
jgi:hypothetical protein